VNRLGGSFQYYSDDHPDGFGDFTATPEGPKAIANAIKDMRALLTIVVHKFPLPIQDIKTKAELDFSGKELNHLDATIIAVLLPLNVSGPRLDYACTLARALLHLEAAYSYTRSRISGCPYYR
jgi:hypothetical protein